MSSTICITMIKLHNYIQVTSKWSNFLYVNIQSFVILSITSPLWQIFNHPCLDYLDIYLTFQLYMLYLDAHKLKYNKTPYYQCLRIVSNFSLLILFLGHLRKLNLSSLTMGASPGAQFCMLNLLSTLSMYAFL